MRVPLLYFSLFIWLAATEACLNSDKHFENNHGNGIVMYRFSVYAHGDSSLTEPQFNFDFKIWHHDQFAIEQIVRVEFHTENKKKARTDNILGYIFIDPLTHSYYCYKTFSDTATPLKKAAHLDSIDKDLGWNFYHLSSVKHEVIPYKISDTTINGISYKRLRYDQEQPEGKMNITAFFRCDKKGSIFTIDTALTRLIGCPLTKTIETPLDTTHSIMQSEFIYLSDTISSQEQKVFAAWKKYADENPIKKEL